MAETLQQLVELFKQQLEAQNERIELQQRQMEKQMEVRQEQMEQLIARLGPPPKQIAGTQPAASIPNFMPFDSMSELWKDYLARFYTFAAANSIPEDKMAQVFLTNQTTANYKLLATLAGQQSPPRRINDLEMKDITTFMESHYDPKQFVVRERFKFWSGPPRKPGEKVTELAARIRQDASTCDFPAIKDIQDEAMRTRFICAVKNEAVLKAVFKLRDDELTFSKAVEIAQEMEEAAKVAKETVHGSSETPSTASVYKMSDKKKPPLSGFKPYTKQSGQYTFLLPKGVCFRCGKTNHTAKDCRFINAICRFCQKKGHLESICLKKKRSQESLKQITEEEENPYEVVNTMFPYSVVKHIPSQGPLVVQLQLDGRSCNLEVDSGARDNFCSEELWKRLGQPVLKPPTLHYVSATGDRIPVMGTFKTQATLRPSSSSVEVFFNVSTLNHLNLIGRSGIATLDIDVRRLIQNQTADLTKEEIRTVRKETPDAPGRLRQACHKLCEQFRDIPA